MCLFVYAHVHVFVCVCVCVCVSTDLVTVVDCGGDLPEDVSGLCLRQSPVLVNVVVQLPSAGVLHHNHNLIPTLKHYRRGKGHTIMMHTSISYTMRHKLQI